MEVLSISSKRVKFTNSLPHFYRLKIGHKFMYNEWVFDENCDAP